MSLTVAEAREQTEPLVMQSVLWMNVLRGEQRGLKHKWMFVIPAEELQSSFSQWCLLLTVKNKLQAAEWEITVGAAEVNEDFSPLKRGSYPFKTDIDFYPE